MMGGGQKVGVEGIVIWIILFNKPFEKETKKIITVEICFDIHIMRFEDQKIKGSILIKLNI